MSVRAVIFDWGGTLTRWHDIDFVAEAECLAQAAVGAPADVVSRLRTATEEVWGRSRDQHRSARLEDVFAAAGVRYDPGRLDPYWAFWEPHTLTDPEAAPMLRRLREDGVRIGVLSNTIWPRARHEGIFARDGVLDLIDGAVYSSEIAWTKPASQAYDAAREAIGGLPAHECVYVGDRLFEDVWGAQRAGLRAIHIPHSDIPVAQYGHSVSEPDATAARLSDIPRIIADWP